MAKKFDWTVDQPTTSELEEKLNSLEEAGGEIYQILGLPALAQDRDVRVLVVSRKPTGGPG